MGEETRYVTWDVHNEFARRVDDENSRQNERLTALERGLQEIGKITANVEVLATNISIMTEEIKKQGVRIEAIEQKPAKRWDLIVTGLISAIVGGIGAAILGGILH